MAGLTQQMQETAKDSYIAQPKNLLEHLTNKGYNVGKSIFSNQEEEKTSAFATGGKIKKACNCGPMEICNC